MALFFPQVSLLPLERYQTILGPELMQKTALRIADLRHQLVGRAVWNVSSSYVGGGVAEMVRSLLAYARGADVDARWVVMRGSPEFFRVTKRLHNAIHGSPGDHSPLGKSERSIYGEMTAEAATELVPLVRPQDIVIIHDPQPAGLIAPLVRQGTKVIWRCHIGSDESNEETQLGWQFLNPYLQPASAYVFSRALYVPPQLDITRAIVIPPSLDPFSTKNQSMSREAMHSILIHSGIVMGQTTASPSFLREDGTPGRVDRYAEILRQGHPPTLETPLVVQVSRWDQLKDPIGVLQGFSLGKGPALQGAHLILAGPNTSSVADDPEDTHVYRKVVEAWHALAPDARARVHLVSLPTTDVEENAALVNALQRHATVITQKSLHEGFGLTVTEAMWKSRAVVASAVGGIQDQIDDGVHGLLLRNPTDLDAFSGALERLLGDPALCRHLGECGHARVLERYLGIDSLLHYGALIEKIDNARQAA